MALVGRLVLVSCMLYTVIVVLDVNDLFCIWRVCVCVDLVDVVRYLSVSVYYLITMCKRCILKVRVQIFVDID